MGKVKRQNKVYPYWDKREVREFKPLPELEGDPPEQWAGFYDKPRYAPGESRLLRPDAGCLIYDAIKTDIFHLWAKGVHDGVSAYASPEKRCGELAIIIESFRLSSPDGEELSLDPPGQLRPLWNLRFEDAVRRDMGRIFEAIAHPDGAKFRCRTRPDKFYIGGKPGYDRIVPVEVLFI